MILILITNLEASALASPDALPSNVLRLVLGTAHLRWCLGISFPKLLYLFPAWSWRNIHNAIIHYTPVFHDSRSANWLKTNVYRFRVPSETTSLSRSSSHRGSSQHSPAPEFKIPHYNESKGIEQTREELPPATKLLEQISA